MKRFRRLDWLVAIPLAAAGGFLLNAATPGINWWALAFLGVPLILASMWHQSVFLGAVTGAIAGFAFWLPQISWLTLYLGPIPWLALSTVMMFWYLLLGMAVALCTRGLTALHWPRFLTVGAQSVTVAGLWVLKELIQGSWPYGGFAWGRLAHSQADGPLVALVSWVGFAGFCAIIAGTGAVPVAFAWSRSWKGNTVLRFTAVAVVVVGVLGALSLIPPAQAHSVGSLRVAAVQGNSKSGIFDDRENGDVFAAHLEASEELLDHLEASGETVDVIVWPENSAEFNLPEQPYRMRAVQKIAERSEAPVIVGSILRDKDGSYTNSALVIDESGNTGLRYDKLRPVPFAEYMPNRAFFHALVPDLVDLVQLDYRPGDGPPALTIPLGEPSQSARSVAEITAGVAICFDIIFDDHAVAMSAAGAEVIFAPTNNADFGHTDESAQQLQIARLRAVESGRALVNISTVGTSAIVLPDGNNADQLVPYTQDFMLAEVPLVQGETPALRYGALITAVILILTLAGSILAIVGLRRARRHPDEPESSV